MDKKTSHLRVQCTCCEAVLTVERSTGEVLFTDKPKKKGVSFEDALLQLQKEKDTADDRFQEAFSREQSRMKTVEEKWTANRQSDPEIGLATNSGQVQQCAWSANAQPWACMESEARSQQ